MQNIQIDGLFTYINNVKNLKLGDKIKLLPNYNNRINSNAIGAYTLNNLKIGYIPFKINQIDINLTFTVTKINLSMNNPILLISCIFDSTNFIFIENDFLKKNKINFYKSEINKKQNIDNLIIELKHFKKYLERSNNQIDDINIFYHDDNYININIICENTNTIFYTVTKKYYEENIFKYDEFYKFKLIPHCIYQPFIIHRLECYIEKNYKYIDTLIKNNKKKFNNLNYNFDIIQLIPINTNNYDYIKLLIYSKIDPHILNNTDILSNDSNLLSIDFSNFINLYDNLKLGTLCYNHKMKIYCYIDLYDNINIIDIIENEIDLNINLYIIKAIIANKKNINLYNPFTGKLFKFELNEIIIEEFISIINKKKLI